VRLVSLKVFIHCVHFCEETNPIGNDWKSITISTNSDSSLNIPQSFSSLLFLPPLDMMFVDDAPNIFDVPDI
jgi:hypothetical protein